MVAARPVLRLDFLPSPSLPAPRREDYTMTTPTTEIGAITLCAMRIELEAAAAVARAAEGLAAAGQTQSGG